MSKQALLDMWAAVHTGEAAEAARADLNIVPPSLMDDALVSMRCRVCLRPHVAAAAMLTLQQQVPPDSWTYVHSLACPRQFRGVQHQALLVAANGMDQRRIPLQYLNAEPAKQLPANDFPSDAAATHPQPCIRPA
jgi:hypothetical protein